MPNTADNKYLFHLTGFRAVAAYLVLITHSLQSAFRYGSDTVTPTIYVTYLANLGMSIFFVLSGFVVTYTYYERFKWFSWWKATRDFAVARFARLYPLYIICLLGDYKQCKWFIYRATWPIRISYLTLTQSWWHWEAFVFAGSWSISTEWFFYVCFAFWMLVTSKERSRSYIINRTLITMAGIILVLAFTFADRVRITVFLSSALGDAGGIWSWWFVYISPYIRVFEFIAGACAARMYMVTRYEGHLPINQKWANILCICSIMFILMLTAYNLIQGLEVRPAYGWLKPDDFFLFLSLNFGYAPFLAYLFYACSRYPNLITKWCSAPCMLFAGEISYSLYLLQFEIIHLHFLAEPVAQSPTGFAYTISFLKAILYILATTIAAYYSYRYIETPSRKFIRRWFE